MYDHDLFVLSFSHTHTLARDKLDEEVTTSSRAMSVFTVAQTARHFYFNYHYPESTSPWFQSAFVRHVQYAIQEVAGFVIAACVAFSSVLSTRLVLPYLTPITTLLCLQQTFGATVSCCARIALALTPLSLFCFVVQKLGLGYHHYLATELLLIFTSFCIAYGCTQAPIKRMTLLYNVSFFAINFSEPSASTLLPFRLLAMNVTGMVIAVLVSLFFFPLFATCDVENRFRYALSKLQQMHVSIIQAFICPDKIGAQMSLVRTVMMENLVYKALGPIQDRLNEARFEPSRWLQRVFNRKYRHLVDMSLQGRTLSLSRRIVVSRRGTFQNRRI